VNGAQVGWIVRTVRIRRGLRQSDVARAAGVGPTTVSQIERGDIEKTSVGVLGRVASAAGVSLVFEARWRGAELPRLLDERHAATVVGVVGRLGGLGWETRPEHTFNIRGERGSIDVLAWRPDARAVLVVEVKTQIVDLQDLLSTLDRKRRLATAVARGIGWSPVVVGTLLVMPDETQARNAVERYRAMFDAAFPMRGSAIREWLRRPAGDLRGVLFLNFATTDANRRPGGVFRVRPKRDRSTAPHPRSSQVMETTQAPSVGTDRPGSTT
jgi:transcriptional regulator with XRE-family HTH domain